MVQGGRFFFVLDEDTKTQIPIVVGVSDSAVVTVWVGLDLDGPVAGPA